LTIPNNAILGTAPASGLIQNDDSMTLAIAGTTATQLEGNSGTTQYTFTVTRTGDTSTATTLNYTVAGSGANPANGADFTASAFPTGTVSFPIGSSSQII